MSIVKYKISNAKVFTDLLLAAGVDADTLRNEGVGLTSVKIDAQLGEPVVVTVSIMAKDDN